MAKRRKKNLSCDGCGARCCRYVATQIDAPTCKRDYDHLRWFLLHRDVHVFIDHETDWYLEFQSDCEALTDEHLCGNYGDRPLICRRHGVDGDDCEFTGEDEPHVERFSTSRELEEYLDRHEIDWRWKRLA